MKPETILHEACTVAGVAVEAVKRRSHLAKFVRARDLFAYAANHVYGYTAASIAPHINRERSSLTYATQRARHMRKHCPEFNRQINVLLARLKSHENQ